MRTSRRLAFGITYLKLPNDSMFDNLGFVFTMDHEVVPRSSRICDWLWKLSRDHFSLHQGKFLKWPWSLRSLKDIFKGLYYIVTRSRGFCNRRGKSGALVGKRQGPVIEKCCLNNVLMICLFCGGGIEDEDTWRQKNDQTWFFIPSHLPFGGIFFLKISTFTFSCMVIPLDPLLLYT